MAFVGITERMGIAKGLLQGIEVVLKLRFGAAGLELMPEIKQIRSDRWLGRILNRLETAESPEDVRRYFQRRLRAMKKEREKWIKAE